MSVKQENHRDRKRIHGDDCMSHYLSKSKYCNAVQCPKMLWLKTYRPECFDESVMNENVLKTGNEVGDLAMGLFGDFVEVTEYTDGKLDIKKMLERTSEEIEKGTSIICEASFSYDGNYCAVDILRNLGENKVEIYEVKSSTAIHDIYYHDAAYQNYVLTKLGYHVNKVCIVHIDSSYVRFGELELNKLFKINDVTDTVKSYYSSVEERISFLNDYMNQKEEPDKALSMDCHKPYECGFYSYCSRTLPSPNIFDISSLRKSTAFELFNRGIVSFEDINTSNALKKNYMIQVEHELNDCVPYIDKEYIKDFVNTLSYPIYFLDFETCQFAIPQYDNSKPYEQIPFQYSLHYIEEKGGILKHKEFLAYPGEDPRRKLAETLCKDIPLNVCTTAYNMSFEKGRIKEMAELYPDLAEHLLNIRDNIKDLMIPFQQKKYYCKAMQGSYSIKYVLPALFPNTPELDYHNLEGVHKGDEASQTFINMQSMDARELEKWRTYLLKYCWLDTFAMVKVWEKLVEVTENK